MQSHKPKADVDHVEEFRRNPIGSIVQLDDGAEAEVLDVLEGDYGRYLKLKRRRDWVHVSRVVAIVVYSVQVNPTYRAAASRARA